MDTQINALVKASLEAQIITAFREAPEAIDALVQAALSKEVDSYGEKPTYSSREKMPYLTWLARETIQNIARAAVMEHITAMEGSIRAAVKARLEADTVVDSFVKTIISATGQDWRINVQFQPDREGGA